MLEAEGGHQMLEAKALVAVVGRVKRQDIDSREAEVKILIDSSMGMLRA